MKTKKKLSPRYLAAKTLQQVYSQLLPAKTVLNELASEMELSSRDRALALNIVLGVLRHRQDLDRLLRSSITLRLKKLNPFVHQALIVGFYQLLYLDSIPDSALVNEAVESCKQAKVPKKLHGFVNGVLRNAVRNSAELQLQRDRESNHPDWLYQRWQQKYGAIECQKICEINNQPAPLVIRVNSSKCKQLQLQTLMKQAGVVAELGLAPESLVLGNYSGSIAELPGYDDGLFQVQDCAAQLASHLLGPYRSNGSYLDGCAGLGGKTSHIRALAGAKAKIVAVEPEQKRTEKFRDNFSRLYGNADYQLETAFFQDFANNCNEKFTGIIIDAPCSGTGVIRRQPDIRWNRTAAEIAENQLLQLQILAAAAPLVETNGILVYATCSLEDEENREVIEEFLLKHPEFIIDDCRKFLDESLHHLCIPANSSDGFYFAPTPQPCIDGFFAARLRRVS